MKFTIYHNPQWSKSRKSLELLREKGVEPNVIEYLKTPLGINELKSIKEKLKLNPKEFVRTNDVKYKELELEQFNGTDIELLQIIIDNPRILERPIITTSKKAVIGRPPENILDLF